MTVSQISTEPQPSGKSWPMVVGLVLALLIIGVVAGIAVVRDDPKVEPKKTVEEEIIERLDTLIVLKCRELDTIGADSLTLEEVEACS